MTVCYLSLCSGIEAATVAWQSLGWEPVAFAEIEPFPCAVLRHHYPDVPNLGDITQIDGRQSRGTVDLVVGGTPCQDFSIAGKRAGLGGERSGLAREFVRVLSECLPQWFIWENVPGVFSTNGGRDFETFLRALDDIGYSCAWRVLDAQFFGVPQRRRRVFVVGYFGDWRPAAKVLFEQESVRRNTSPRRKTRKDIAGTIKGGSGNRGWTSGAEDNFIAVKTGPLTGTSARGSRDENMAADDFCVPCDVLALRTAQTSSNGHGIAENIAHTLDGATGQAVLAYAPPIVEQAMSCKWAKGTSGPAGDEHYNLIAFHGSQAPDISGDITHPLGTNGGQECCLFHKSVMQVRRLTPKECERLMGFPDDYTAIEYRGKPASDSVRYKALGNSMAVPVMRWIGHRLELHHPRKNKWPNTAR